MKTNRMPIIIGVSVLALCLAVIGSAAESVSEPGASSQADYPVLPDPPFASTVSTTLTDQVRDASLIIDGTVLEVLPIQEGTMVVPPGSPEEAINDKSGTGDDSSTFPLGAIRLKVNDVLLGSVGDEVIMYISPFAIDAAPDFKPGDRLMFFLFKNVSGKYFSASFQDAYYYVSKDSRVYPAVVTDQLKQYSGKGLGPFKSSVNAIKRELRKT